MASTQCSIGEIIKAADEIVILTITCIGQDITKSQMVEAVNAIDSIAKKPSPLFLDASQPHSISFDALFEMAKATNIVAVAIYAPSKISQSVAEYIEQFQNTIVKAPYPFKIFSDSVAAKEWLRAFA